MGYSVYFEIDTGGAEMHILEDSVDTTYNVAKVFYDILDFDKGLRILEGMTAKDAIPVLKIALKKFDDPSNKTRLESYMPRNGWGTMATTREFLVELLSHAEKHPKSTIKIA